MQEVLLVAVVQPLQQLPHERLDVVLVKVDQAGLQQPHQVMVHVLKHKVERTWVWGEGADVEQELARVGSNTTNSYFTVIFLLH